MSTEPADAEPTIRIPPEEVARNLRRSLNRAGTLMVNLISSPGAGKTSLLEATIRKLRRKVRIAALEGDAATDLDAERICRLGVPARQILTGDDCRLDVHQIEYEWRHLGGRPPDILFVENVGGLICPARHDLGEDFKVTLLSVAEGEDEPLKYPAAFSHASVVVITKIDLLPHVAFDPGRACEEIATLNRDATVLATSALTGEGIDRWCRLLEDRLWRKSASGNGPERHVPLAGGGG
jgi:hydrogenase nickel incorporation protein HypB